MTIYSYLATPRATRAVCEEFGLVNKHRLGQNFLVSDAVVGRILQLAELTAEDVVLEVGPGIGTLTVALLPRVAAVLAIEADHRLVEVLQTTCAAVGASVNADAGASISSGTASAVGATDGTAVGGTMALIEGDALRVSTDRMSDALRVSTDRMSDALRVSADRMRGVSSTQLPTRLVSNLPYQIAATLVLQYLEEITSVTRAVVMVQSEVADRMCAHPNTKSYGAYTAKLALVGTVTGRFEVAPSNFMPAPHVDSAVVRIDRTQAINPLTGMALTPQELMHARKVIDASFAQRRKTLRNSLRSSGFSAHDIHWACEKSGIDPSLRAEALEPADFIRLSLVLNVSPRKA